MLINISEILSTTSKSESFTAQIEMAYFMLHGDKYDFEQKEPVELVITNIGNREILLEGCIHVVLNIPCNRCLEKVKTDFNLTLDKKVNLKKSSEEEIRELNETSFIIGSDLDVDLLVHSEILLNFPMKTVCQDDCQGICYQCGTNLNKENCQCERESLDPRMAAIQDIFNNFKEV